MLFVVSPFLPWQTVQITSHKTWKSFSCILINLLILPRAGECSNLITFNHTWRKRIRHSILLCLRMSSNYFTSSASWSRWWPRRISSQPPCCMVLSLSLRSYELSPYLVVFTNVVAFVHQISIEIKIYTSIIRLILRRIMKNKINFGNISNIVKYILVEYKIQRNPP